MKYLICIVLIILFAEKSGYTQKISNINYEFSDDQMFIFYDLAGPLSRDYWIDLHISEDDGQTWKQLHKVSGAVGPSINPGTRKKIVWNRILEDADITRAFQFQVQAEPDVYSGAGLGDFVDKRTGASYKWVRIGNQIWMAQNLNIGMSIQNMPQTDNGKIERYCFDNDIKNCNTYGGLYQWDEMLQYSKTYGNQGICPVHWHLPAESEWASLIFSLGGRKEAYGKMKELGNQHWSQQSRGITNESRLSILPGGMKNSDTTGVFIGLRNQACFWTATENDSISAKAVGLNGQVLEVYFFNGMKTDSYSVRCVRD